MGHNKKDLHFHRAELANLGRLLPWDKLQKQKLQSGVSSLMQICLGILLPGQRLPLSSSLFLEFSQALHLMLEMMLLGLLQVVNHSVGGQYIPNSYETSKNVRATCFIISGHQIQV